MKIITRTATAYDKQGYLAARNVTVCDFGDTVGIGASEHLKDDLIITATAITSKLAGWTISL